MFSIFFLPKVSTTVIIIPVLVNYTIVLILNHTVAPNIPNAKIIFRQ